MRCDSRQAREDLKRIHAEIERIKSLDRPGNPARPVTPESGDNSIQAKSFIKVGNMSITKELNKPIPGRDLLGIVGMICFALWVIYVHNGSQEIRGNMRSEQACLDKAKTRTDVDDCFSLIHKNMAKE